MSKTFYNTTTGDGAVFDDAEDMSNWPDFQETPLDMTAINSTKVRAERDALLAASDSMALADRITDEWRTYRQSLRDLPAAEGFPDVTFPTPPS